MKRGRPRERPLLVSAKAWASLAEHHINATNQCRDEIFAVTREFAPAVCVAALTLALARIVADHGRTVAL